MRHTWPSLNILRKVDGVPVNLSAYQNFTTQTGHTPSVTYCTLSRMVKKCAIRIGFDGGDVSGIGGVELLRAADDRLGLCKVAAKLLPDPRHPPVYHAPVAVLAARHRHRC